MIQIEIPGFANLSLSHLVLDYNGTLALDGKLLPGAREVIQATAKLIEIHVLTADTFGLAESQLSGLPVKLVILSAESQADAKAVFITDLGASETVAVGNGRNDRKMLAAAALSIAVVQKEGASMETLGNAHVVAPSIWDALDLLSHPKRLIATLRS